MLLLVLQVNHLNHSSNSSLPLYITILVSLSLPKFTSKNKIGGSSLLGSLSSSCFCSSTISLFSSCLLSSSIKVIILRFTEFSLIVCFPNILIILNIFPNIIEIFLHMSFKIILSHVCSDNIIFYQIIICLKIF